MRFSILYVHPCLPASSSIIESYITETAVQAGISIFFFPLFTACFHQACTKLSPPAQRALVFLARRTSHVTSASSAPRCASSAWREISWPSHEHPAVPWRIQQCGSPVTGWWFSPGRDEGCDIELWEHVSSESGLHHFASLRLSDLLSLCLLTFSGI